MHDTLFAATALPLPARQWLRDHAPSLDRTTRHAAALLPLLARAGLLQPSTELDGAVDAVAEVASESLAAGLVLYAQRSFIEVLGLSHNAALREYLMPTLEEGRLAGTLGLSGAFGHLAHGTPLPVRGTETPRGWKLSGRLSWVPNLQHDGYAVALPVAFDGLKDFALVMLGSEESGLSREAELSTGHLRSLRAAPLQLERVHFREDELLHVSGALHLRELLPRLLALQCGLALGVAQAASAAAAAQDDTAAQRAALQRLDAGLADSRAALSQGLREGQLLHDIPALARLRAHLVELAQAAAQAERQALAAQAALGAEHGGCARRTSEAQFLAHLHPNAADLPSQPSPARRAA